MKHAGSIADRQNYDRILLQFPDMSGLYDSDTSLQDVGPDPDFVSSLAVFNQAYEAAMTTT